MANLKRISRKVIFDEHGKTIDATTGEEIHIPQRTPTLRVLRHF